GSSSRSAGSTSTTTSSDSGTSSTPSGTTTTQTATPPPATLVSSDRPLAPAQGQLSSFSGFPGKDPFVQQVHFAPTLSSGTSAPTGKAVGKTPLKQPKLTSKGFTVDGSQSASVTVVSVNGVRQTLVAGTAF